MAEGRFQVATGAVVVNSDNGKVLLLHRGKEVIEAGLWEYPAGRLEQFEDIEAGLHREVEEETGITELEVLRPIRTFTYMRGGDKADNEVKGIVFLCHTTQSEVKLAEEHDEYRWLDFGDAIKLVEHPGIKQDLLIAEKERR